MKDKLIVFVQGEDLYTIVNRDGKNYKINLDKVLAKVGFRYGLRVIPAGTVITEDGQIKLPAEDDAPTLDWDKPEDWFST